MKKLTLAAVGLLAFSTSFASAEVAQSVRNYWLECDATSACIAEVNGFGPNYTAITLRLERSVAADAPVLVTLQPEHDLVQGTQIRFDIPGVTQGIVGTAGYVNPGNATSFAEPATSALIDAIKRGTTMIVSVSYGGALGTIAYEVPLVGAIDSLTLMDVVQQRLGRTDAAVARGAQPPSSFSDLFPSEGEEIGGEDMGGLVEDEDTGDAHMEEGPNGSYVDLLYSPEDLPEYVHMAGYRLAQCEDVAGPMNEVGAILNRDQTGRKTWLVPCAIGKANVKYYVVMHHPERGLEYEFLEFELPLDFNKPNRNGILNPQWDPDSNRLIATRYANVNRNCGAYEIHEWRPDGNFFELVEYREKKDCGGPMTQPQDFPLYWTIAELGD